MYSSKKKQNQENKINVSLNLNTKRITMLRSNISPVESYDFYEARTENRYVILNDIMLGCTSLPITTISLHLTSTHPTLF
jgi:hypothetical protein